MKLAVMPEIPENLVNLEKPNTGTTNMTVNGKDRGRSLGDAKYEFEEGGTLPFSEIVWVLKNNAKKGA